MSPKKKLCEVILNESEFLMGTVDYFQNHIPYKSSCNKQNKTTFYIKFKDKN